MSSKSSRSIIAVNCFHAWFILDSPLRSYMCGFAVCVILSVTIIVPVCFFYKLTPGIRFTPGSGFVIIIIAPQIWRKNEGRVH